VLQAPAPDLNHSKSEQGNARSAKEKGNGKAQQLSKQRLLRRQTDEIKLDIETRDDNMPQSA
jgi:hypothetical protein